MRKTILMMPDTKINPDTPAKSTGTIEVMRANGANLQQEPADVSPESIAPSDDIVNAPDNNQEAPVGAATQGGDVALPEGTPRWEMMSKRVTVSLFEATCLALNLLPNSKNIEALKDAKDVRVSRFNSHLNIVKDHNRSGLLASAQPDRRTGRRSTRVKLRDFKEWVKSSGVFTDPKPPDELLNLKTLDEQAAITESQLPRSDEKTDKGDSKSLKGNAEVPPRIEKAAVSRIEGSLLDIVLGLAISHYDFVPVGVPGGVRNPSDMNDVYERISEALHFFEIEVSHNVIESRLAEATARRQSLKDKDGLAPIIAAINKNKGGKA